MRGPELPTDDLYGRLELPSDAAPEAIEIAWRALLKLHHPDVAGEASLETAKRINIAHDWLSDPELRARYDRSRGTRAPGPPARRRGPRRPGRDELVRPIGMTTSTSGARSTSTSRPPPSWRSSTASPALEPDEIDRLGSRRYPAAGIRREHPALPESANGVATLDAVEARVSERLPRAARALPAAHDAVTSFGQYLVLEGFLGDLLSEPFLERVEERMTRGWLAAVGRTRYGPRTSDVRALIDAGRPAHGRRGRLAGHGRAALGLSDRLWPHGTDPDEDDVLRVSATLAARDASAAARASGADARTQSAVAAFARVLALAPAFGADGGGPPPASVARARRPGWPRRSAGRRLGSPAGGPVGVDSWS